MSIICLPPAAVSHSSQLLAPGHVGIFGPSCTYQNTHTHALCVGPCSSQPCGERPVAGPGSLFFPGSFTKRERNMYINLCAHKYMHAYTNVGKHAQMGLVPREPLTPWSLQQLSGLPGVPDLLPWSHPSRHTHMQTYSSGSKASSPALWLVWLDLCRCLHTHSHTHANSGFWHCGHEDLWPLVLLWLWHSCPHICTPHTLTQSLIRRGNRLCWSEVEHGQTSVLTSHMCTHDQCLSSPIPLFPMLVPSPNTLISPFPHLFLFP